MIQSASGDIFALPAHTIVNPVNCVGVMGRGLALQFKRRHPDAYRAIAHFPTKRHWRDPSRLDDIRTGLDDLAAAIARRAIPSIAIPPLGCGLGGLPWQDVEPLIVAALAPLPATVIVLQPTPPRS